jgi:hypothetical protein
MLSVSGFLPMKCPPSCVPHTLGGFTLGFKIKVLDCVIGRRRNTNTAFSL